MRVDLSKRVSFVPCAVSSDELLEMTKVVGPCVRVDVLFIDKQCEPRHVFGVDNMMAHTFDFSREAWVLMDVILSEDSIRVVDLHLGDVRSNFLALSTTFVLQFNDRHLSFGHLHYFSKVCAIWE